MRSAYWKDVKGYPEAPKTIGEWVRKRRLDLGLEQTQAAERLGAHVETIKNWERGVLKPAITVMPKVIEFLGFNPLPKPTTFAERLVYYRTAHGFRQAELAARLQVNPSTLGRWEAGFVPPVPRMQEIEVQIDPLDASNSVCRRKGHEPDA